MVYLPLLPSEIPAASATEKQLVEFAQSIDGYELAGGLEQAVQVHNKVTAFEHHDRLRDATEKELRIALYFASRTLRPAGAFKDQTAGLIQELRQRAARS